AEHHQLLGRLHAEQERRDQHGRAEAVPDLDLAELRVLGGDGHVAHPRDLAALADGVAAHRGDHRLRHGPDAHDVVHHARHLDALRSRRRLEVAAGAERAPGADDDHRAHLVVLGGALDGAREVERERPVDGVQHERAVEDDAGDGAVDLVTHVVLGRRRDLVALRRIAPTWLALLLRHHAWFVAHGPLLLAALPAMLACGRGAGERGTKRAASAARRPSRRSAAAVYSATKVRTVSSFTSTV